MENFYEVGHFFLGRAIFHKENELSIRPEDFYRISMLQGYTLSPQVSGDFLPVNFLRQGRHTSLLFRRFYTTLLYHRLYINWYDWLKIECIGQRCWHNFVIKDVKQAIVTLNVTDMDRINIVSLHRLYSKCPPLNGHTLDVFLATGQ